MMKTRYGRGAYVASAIVALVISGKGAQADPPKGDEARHATVDANHATDDKSGEAANHFKRGLQLFDEGDYTLALVEFERAYQLAPNYRALYNIALVDMQLSRYANASRTLDAYLRDGGDAIAPARRAEVAKVLAELKLRTATIDLTVNVAMSEVTLDGKAIEPSLLHGPLLIDAGEHALHASAPGFQAQDRTVTLAGGDHVAVRLDLLATAPARPAGELPMVAARAVFWPGFVATGALAVGAAVSGGVMLESRSHLSSLQNTPGSDAGDRENAATRTNTAALATDILAGLAVVTGGVSLYLSLGTSEHASKTPQIAIGPRRIAISGSF